MTHRRERPQELRFLLFALLLFAVSGVAPGSEPPQEIDVPAWFKHSFLDLRDDVREATAVNRRVMIYFGQNGCPYCKRLMEVNFKQQDIADRMRKHFDAIETNIFGNRNVTWIDGKTRSEKDLAVLLRVQFTPTLLFLDEKGAIALRVNGYYPPERFVAALDYVLQRAERKGSFAEFQDSYVRNTEGGALRDDPLFRKPPYVFDRRKPATRPLAIIFERPNCSDCTELHATALKAAATRRLLSRFEVYRLNLLGDETVITPGGANTIAAQWARDLNLLYAPSVVFFDTKGKEIFRVEAYLRTFHLQSALDYVASNAYLREPNFQRYIQTRAVALRERGGRVDVMN